MSVRPVRSQSRPGSPVMLSKYKTASERRPSSAVAGARPLKKSAAIATSTTSEASVATGSAQRRRPETAATSRLRPDVVPSITSPVSTSRFRSSRSRRRSVVDW